MTGQAPGLGPEEREALVERSGLVRVGSWCPGGGGHLLPLATEDARDGFGCRARAYPVFVLPRDAEDAQFVRIAVREGR